MKTVDDIFVAFGGSSAFARAMELKTSTASEMRRRRSIPVEYWQRLLDTAKRKGIRGLTCEKLMVMHTPVDV